MKRKLMAFFLANILAMSTMVFIVPMTACNVGTLIQDITKFLPVATDILSIVTQFTGTSYTSLGQKIQTDAALVQKLYTDYESNVGNGGAWNDLNAAFTTFSADVQQAFALAQVANPVVQGKIVAMVAAAQTLFAIIESLLPSPPASAGPAAVKSAHFAAHAPSQAGWTLGDCVTSWNKLMVTKTGNTALDASTAKMQIHIHSWLLRQVTFHGAK